MASGISVNLFEIQGDLRYVALFVLALVPLVVANNTDRLSRGWSLVLIGNLLIFLTLLLPAGAAAQLLDGAEALFEEGTRISNPRIFTSAAIAISMLGGYIIMFGGLLDLGDEGVAGWQRGFAASAGALLVVIFLLNGSLDIYSIMVEFYQRGETLGQRFVEHIVFVLVSLAAGLIIGIALGLWAARDRNMEDIILYTVGIIQTIPSLALFGVLLVPLARLGDQQLSSVLTFFIITLVIGLVVFFIVSRLQSLLTGVLQQLSVIVAFIALFIPVGLFSILLITFGFEAVLTVFADPALNQSLTLVGLGYVAVIFILWLDRRIDEANTVRWLRYVRLALTAVSTVALVVLIVLGGREVIGNNSFSELSMRDLGVSGIGTAPAIIALTLYSLLPLVRNTYAGLRNVDPAVIDSGRGMGMTP
ncbi:MAG: hypothetical protein AAFR56_20625, partial [Chloroflexota bacterium]